MKNRTNPFRFRQRGNVVEVWEGEPGESESEFVMAVDITLLDALIATLKSVKGRR